CDSVRHMRMCVDGARAHVLFGVAQEDADAAQVPMPEQNGGEGAADSLLARQLARREDLRVEEIDDLRAERGQLGDTRATLCDVRCRLQNRSRPRSSSSYAPPPRAHCCAAGWCPQIVGIA